MVLIVDKGGHAMKRIISFFCFYIIILAAGTLIPGCAGSIEWYTFEDSDPPPPPPEPHHPEHQWHHEYEDEPAASQRTVQEKKEEQRKQPFEERKHSHRQSNPIVRHKQIGSL